MPDEYSSASERSNRVPPPPAPRIVDDGVAASLFAAARPIDVWQPPSPEELQPVFPQFEIRGILGRGGMGAVYKGWQKSLDRFVAIKVLPPGIDDRGMNFAERFKQEAKAMAMFHHPGIVAVHDAGETAAGLLYFIMECVEGTDLAGLVARHGRLPAAEAVRIIGHVCEALAYAHERGVVHRDIKPSNVMIETDGTVKVADFGLAKLSSVENSTHTMSRFTLGSPDFMAPEALDGKTAVDHRADIYAAGVMLYQLLTGEIPRGRFSLPSELVAGLDRRLDAIVEKSMQADRERRYGSAVEMRSELVQVAGESGEASGPRARVPSAASVHRGRVRVSSFGGPVVLMVIASGLAAWWSRSGGEPGGRSASTAELANAHPSTALGWRDAFAESPLKEVIAKADHGALGYRLPGGNHWSIAAQPSRSGAVRVRATSGGEKFVSVFVLHEDRQFERVRFVGRTGEWVLSHGMMGATESRIAGRVASSPLDGQPHELLFARVGGRLRVVLDGHSLHDEADPNSTPGTFMLDIYPEADISAERVEYLALDGVPEIEAEALLGIGKQ